MKKILLLSLLSVYALRAGEVGTPFIEIKQEPDESRLEYFERIHPILPTGREVMHAKLNEDKMIFKRNGTAYLIKHKDISDARALAPSLLDTLLMNLDAPGEPVRRTE